MAYNLRLSQNFINYLIEQPETGMGYHLVEIELKDGTVLKDRIILNSEYIKLQSIDEIFLDEIKRIEIK
ncbi:MAG: hypothetical protein IT221_03990 [Fluviicola sp.]|nr:hypothetical protein [Fluviicola sp.]